MPIAKEGQGAVFTHRRRTILRYRAYTCGQYGAVRALPRDFGLVARADGVMNGQYDLWLAVYEAAGADEDVCQQPCLE